MTYCTGGIITVSGLYRIHTFKANGTLTVVSGGNARVFLLGGGGAGGLGSEPGKGGGGGGGGGGGYKYFSAEPLTTGAKSVVVGAGALPDYTPKQGGSSTFNGRTALGGGGGGCGPGWSTGDGQSGPTGGGGAAFSHPGGIGTLWNGDWGADSSKGWGGGGGGAGGAGHTGTVAGEVTGGEGISIDITGTVVKYGGGGGGGSMPDGGRTKGRDGGGNGGANTVGSPGVANTGGGGGGGGASYGSSYFGGAGGSGIVIVSYIYRVNGQVIWWAIRRWYEDLLHRIFKQIQGGQLA